VRQAQVQHARDGINVSLLHDTVAVLQTVAHGLQRQQLAFVVQGGSQCLTGLIQQPGELQVAGGLPQLLLDGLKLGQVRSPPARATMPL
jgi:hypothetical protein